MIAGIPFFRFIVYFCLLCTIPIFALFCWQQKEMRAIESLTSEVTEAQMIMLMAQKKGKANRQLQETHRFSDSRFVEKYLTGPLLLQNEKEMLLGELKDYNLIPNKSIQNRLFEIENNKMSFSEGSFDISSVIQESVLSLNKNIEVDLLDLERLLSVVDGKKVGRFFVTEDNSPQLMVLDFSLERVNRLEKKESYLLNIKLLKREFL